MERNDIFKLIHLDDHSATPKYQQLANSIVNAIENGEIGKDSIMPSINELSFEFQISRDTAEKGYKHLKSIGILGSVPGKGFYIKSTQVSQKVKIFLLFNKLSAHKKIITIPLFHHWQAWAQLIFIFTTTTLHCSGTCCFPNRISTRIT